MLHVQNLTTANLNNVSFDIQPGLTVLLGASGCGKTTLLRIIAVHNLSFLSTRKIKGIVKWNTIPKCLRFIPSSINEEWKKFTLRENLKMNAVVDPESYTSLFCATKYLDANSNSLSTGEWRLISICVGFCNVEDNGVVIVDELTNGLDAIKTNDILGAIKQLVLMKGLTVITSAHQIDMNNLKMCDQVLLMQQHELVASGTVDEVTNWLDSQHFYTHQVSRVNQPSTSFLRPSSSIFVTANPLDSFFLHGHLHNKSSNLIRSVTTTMDVLDHCPTPIVMTWASAAKCQIYSRTRGGDLLKSYGIGLLLLFLLNALLYCRNQYTSNVISRTNYEPEPVIWGESFKYPTQGTNEWLERFLRQVWSVTVYGFTDLNGTLVQLQAPLGARTKIKYAEFGFSEILKDLLPFIQCLEVQYKIQDYYATRHYGSYTATVYGEPTPSIIIFIDKLHQILNMIDYATMANAPLWNDAYKCFFKVPQLSNVEQLWCSVKSLRPLLAPALKCVNWPPEIFDVVNVILPKVSTSSFRFNDDFLAFIESLNNEVPNFVVESNKSHGQHNETMRYQDKKPPEAENISDSQTSASISRITGYLKSVYDYTSFEQSFYEPTFARESNEPKDQKNIFADLFTATDKKHRLKTLDGWTAMKKIVTFNDGDMVTFLSRVMTAGYPRQLVELYYNRLKSLLTTIENRLFEDCMFKICDAILRLSPFLITWINDAMRIIWSDINNIVCIYVLTAIVGCAGIESAYTFVKIRQIINPLNDITKHYILRSLFDFILAVVLAGAFGMLIYILLNVPTASYAYGMLCFAVLSGLGLVASHACVSTIAGLFGQPIAGILWSSGFLSFNLLISGFIVRSSSILFNVISHLSMFRFVYTGLITVLYDNASDRVGLFPNDTSKLFLAGLRRDDYQPTTCMIILMGQTLVYRLMGWIVFRYMHRTTTLLNEE